MRYMSKGLIKMLKPLDLFGQNILLNLNGEDQYKTSLGGFLTLMILGIVVLFFQSNIQDFVNKVNIQSEISEVFEDEPDSITLNDTNFMFAVAIEQDNFNTNPFFNVTFRPKQYIRLDNGTQTKSEIFLDLVPCTIERFQQIFDPFGINFTNQFQEIGFQTWLCPRMNYSISMKGRYTNTQFDFTKIAVSKCMNNTSQNELLTWKPICAPEEVVESYLISQKSFRIKLYIINLCRYITNLVINPGKSRDYIQTFLDDELFFSFVPNVIGKQTDIFFTKYSLETDENILPVGSDIQAQQLFLKKQGDFRDQTVSPTDSYVALYLRRSPYTTYIQRSYQKLDKLLSVLGGSRACPHIQSSNEETQPNLFRRSSIQIKQKVEKNMDCTFVIQNDLKVDVGPKPTTPVNNPQPKGDDQLEWENANNSFMPNNNQTDIAMFNTAQFQNEIDRQAKTQNQEARPQLLQKNILKRLGIHNRKEYLTQQIQLMLDRSKPIMLTLKFVLHQLFCGKFFQDKNCILLDKAIKKINQDLDICVIIDKVNEINFIKELLLEKEQQILFNFAPKEIISLEDTSKHHLPGRRDSKRAFTKKLGVQFNDVAKMMMDQRFKKGQFVNAGLQIYYKLYQAYESVLLSDERDNRFNKILIQKLGSEVKEVFDISKFIQQDQKIRIIDKIRKKRQKQDEEPIDEMPGLLSMDQRDLKQSIL